MSNLKIIGHRGARGLGPENTIASINKALEYKTDAIEFDIRVTKDQIPVLHHNSKLTDASGNKLSIKDNTYLELKKHKVDLATLEEAIILASGRAPLYIEVKPRVLIQPIVMTLDKFLETGSAENDFWLGSKSQKTLRELHRELPSIGKIVIEPLSGIRAIWRARQVDTKILSMYRRFLWFGFIKSMNRRGYELYAYTLNDPRKARRWEKYGLAGVVTDYPDRFQRSSIR